MKPAIGSDYGYHACLIRGIIQTRLLVVVLIILSFLLVSSRVNAQTAQFSVQAEGGSFCAPAKISFTPTFSEKPEYFYWKFGLNDEESELNSPVFTYSTPGSYPVVLTVVFKNAIREVTTMVNVNGPSQVTIASDREFLCKPGDQSFTLKNIDTLKKATWSVANGNQIANTQNIPVNFSFPNFGSYNIAVEVENKWGCKSVTTRDFKVEKPKAVIKDTLINGCLPADVNFAANIILPAGSSVSRYSWDFDDGTPSKTTNLNRVSHTFTVADTFFTTLSITTAEGCENTFSFPPVAFGTPPVLTGIVPSNDTICGSEELRITASSPKANGYICQISDGTVYESIDGRFSHKFKGLGVFSIKVTPKYNGCAGVADSIRVLVRGVIANYTFTNTCAQKNRFNFRNTSAGTANGVQWYFEESLTPINNPNPEYIFPEQGKFPFAMIVKNNATGCADTTGGVIFTAKPRLAPIDTFACLGSMVSMQVNESYPSPKTTYNWNFAGKTVPNGASANLSVTADIEGLFTNRVIISNGIGYCRDTLTQPLKLRVAGIFADFETNSPKCTNGKIVLKNTSTSIYGFGAGTKWSWDFGNGISSEDREPAAVVYTNPGSMKISLNVTDSKGCTDSARKVLKITRSPLLKLLPREQKVCQGKEFSLNAFHTGSIQWSPSNLVDCDTCAIVKVKPLKPTEYLVTAKDSIGCATTDTVKLDVWYPFELSANLLRDTAVCYGNSVQFDLQTSQKVVLWSPDYAISAKNIPNPVAKPEFTTTYTATVTDSAGCFSWKDSAVLTINPLPVVDHDTLLIVPFDEPFTISPKYSNDIATYAWQPANLLSCSDCANPSGKATGPAFFEVNVVSDKGCTASAKINLVIDCSDKNIFMPTAFSPDNNGLNDYYYPLTKGIRKIKRFAVFNRFGQIIFEKREFVPNNRLDGWDGTFKGALQPAGMYTYWVEILCGSGNLQSYKGSFFLFR